MPPSSADYLIIGAGVFGASTAFHLSQQEPLASIILVDQSPFPCPLGASHDINKIIRADYGDKFYCKLALEAQKSWRRNPIFRPYYHQTGMVVLEDTGLGGRIIENYKQLGENCEAEIFDSEQLKRRFGGIFHDTDLHGVKEIFFNPLSGWAEATATLTRVIEVAVEQGVRYVKATISRLIFDKRDACIGVRATDGTVIYASKIVLCTGAGTAKLLMDSAPSRPELWVKDRLIAAGVCIAAVKLTEAQVRKFGDVPVLVHEVSNVLGEMLPPTPNGELKFCRDLSFTNPIIHPTSGETISIPHFTSGETQWTTPTNISPALRQELYGVMRGIYGHEADGLELETFRLCCMFATSIISGSGLTPNSSRDAITPSQNPLVTPHRHCPNLYFATGGSFHGWKFLPVIGKYVVQMLKGQLEDEMRRRWAWDKGEASEGGGAHGGLWPQREFPDVQMGMKWERARI